MEVFSFWRRRWFCSPSIFEGRYAQAAGSRAGGFDMRVIALIAGFVFGFVFWWILDQMGGDL